MLVHACVRTNVSAVRLRVEQREERLGRVEQREERLSKRVRVHFHGRKIKEDEKISMPPGHWTGIQQCA